ncbi:hypothetical protein FLONG3_6338 [Fusarium longipes]|uniref:Uncharacterized protein n=1 Tax=Fusarium longipes TaxID=694270 RepID=A0A395SMW5_9HYPO|nr:hypothetical protein FLONG3_6338 [Fusarium longipes]
MSDNIDHTTMVQAACLADLGRHRQEELPLSNEARRGPTYAPDGRNGTDGYSNHRKTQLISKWGNKIEDDETRQMEGLEIEDARPWARDLVGKALSSNRIERQVNTSEGIRTSANTLNSGPPPRIAARKPKTKKSSSQHQQNSAMVHFKPPTNAWKDCVQNMVNNSPVQSPMVTKWGPQRSGSTPSAAPQCAVSKPVHGDIPNSPSNVTSGNATMTITSANAADSSVGSRVHLTFSLHQDGFDSNAVETIIGSGHCQVVPSKNEALSFTSSVVVKIHEEKGGVLALRSELKGDKIHDVLDIEKPLLDGQYCVIKVNSHKWPYHLRFDKEEHVKLFKMCLSRVKKAVRLHKKPETVKDSEAGNAGVTGSAAELSTVYTTTDTTGASTSVTDADGTVDNNADVDTATTVTHVPQAVQAAREMLITMDDNWDSSNNPQVPLIQEAVNPMVALIRRCLEYFSSEGNFCAGTIAGIEDAILDKWMGDGFLKDCDERQREASIAMLRTFVEVELILTGKKAMGKPSESNTDQQSCSQRQDAAPEQANGSSKRPKRGVTQGLAASCFASKPYPFKGLFTGPRPQAAYK